MLRDPSLEPRLPALAEFPLEQIISDKFDHGRERMRSGNKPGDDGPRPPQPRMFAQVNRFVWSSGERAGTRDDLAFETFERGGAEHAAVNAFGARIGREVETLKLADVFGAQRNSTSVIERKRELLLIAQMTHQKRGALVDETLRQFFVQGVGEAIFDGTRDRLPMR